MVLAVAVQDLYPVHAVGRNRVTYLKRRIQIVAARSLCAMMHQLRNHCQSFLTEHHWDSLTQAEKQGLTFFVQAAQPWVRSALSSEHIADIWLCGQETVPQHEMGTGIWDI